LVTSNNVYSPIERHPVNLPVTPGGKFEVWGYTNFDTGTATMQVELVLE
jgi:hypothetical protein